MLKASTKRRSRAAIPGGAPAVSHALFVKSDASAPEWAATVTSGTAVAVRRTWSADATLGKAAELAARCVRVPARPADDGKYAKYTPAGFVLARANEDVAISNGSAQKGSTGRSGVVVAGASGSTSAGALGSGVNDGADGTKTRGNEGSSGTSSQGAAGAAGLGLGVVDGVRGGIGTTGHVRAALAAKVLADASLATGSGIFVPRVLATGAMPSFSSIASNTAYTQTLSGTLLAYGVASKAQSLSWDVHVLVGSDYVLVDQRALQACPSLTYREYTLAATPPACTEFRITFSAVTVGGGQSEALVSVLALA